MFNSGIKGNQRCNGLVPPTSIVKARTTTVGQTIYSKLGKTIGGTKNSSTSSFNNVETHFDATAFKNSFTCPNAILQRNLDSKVKIEYDQDQDVETHISPSIIGLSEDVIKTHKSPNIKPRLKWGSIRATHHETLQRIDKTEDLYNHYQQYWFSASLESFKLEDRSREERIEITRHEFLRHLQQIVRSNVGKTNDSLQEIPVVKASDKFFLARHLHQSGYDRLVAPMTCQVESCLQPALPCTRHCTLHIMLNTEQVLFSYCTAKFADNTQCSVPVFDITHELPLCPEHARKRDNYKLYQEAKPKKLRKKVKPSAMIRPQKRNKKKKKPLKTPETTTPSAIINIPVTSDVGGEIVDEGSPELEEDMHMVDQVLGLNESDGLEQVLATQASHLLEESDISTVLSTIQVDEFSDLFTVNRNGEYEPSREEAEELEKALAAVDNDVKSLEKLTAQGLIDTLLDEDTLAESLVQIPDMFHNGYNTPCGDSVVAQTSSFLLPVEPQSHS